MQNIHPFLYDGYHIAMAHNGKIPDIAEMHPFLLKHIRPEIAKLIRGTTDTEWIYSTLLSQLENPTADDIPLDEVREAVTKTLKIFYDIRVKCKNSKPAPINLFISSGEYLLVIRFVFNYGHYSNKVHAAFIDYHSLWYTYGEQYGFFDGEFKMKGSKKECVIFASEPLTEDTTTWIEAPEYTMVTAHYEKKDTIKIRTYNIDV